MTQNAETNATAAADRSWIGGRYRIERTLAEGGMGVVYCVTDEQTGELLALKRMLPSSPKELQSLFEREYRTLVGLQHPRIIRAFDYGVDAGVPYYTMELLAGRDLYEFAPIPFEQACRYLRDVATSLALLHTRRLLHRDVTPRNIRIAPDGSCKLLDFGALTSFGIPDRTVGTPPFIPPEALHKAPLDQRADIFSFGALAYWLLTRRHAYPARNIEDLPTVWQKRPVRPSRYVPDIPKRAEELILRLLSLDPLARPSSIADVVAKLESLARLAPEDEVTQRALGASYLSNVQFIGRERELDALRQSISGLSDGLGSAVWIEGPGGVGRTRLVGELVLQSEIMGVPSILIDAATHRQANGVAVALLRRLIELSPSAAREAAARSETLSQLDRTLASALEANANSTQRLVPLKHVGSRTNEFSGSFHARAQEDLFAVVAAACERTPLLIAVDNVNECDEASLSLLAAVQRLCQISPLVQIASARTEEEITAPSLLRVKESRTVYDLAPFTSDEALRLATSIFGDVPDLPRFAEWMHMRADGRPLHCLELLKRLHAEDVVRYTQGLWILPVELPDGAIPAGLDALIAHRLTTLSEPAYRLAEAISVQRRSASHEQSLELAQAESPGPIALLDELVIADVLDESIEGYRFSHGSLRTTLLKNMDVERRRTLHRRCAEYELARRGDDASLFANIEAGWHLLQGGDEDRGAELLSEVAFDSAGVRFVLADLQVAAPALEAALAVYTRQGRSIYERMPLLAALAQAGYYEDRIWNVRYGEEALVAVQEVAGLTLARKLQPKLGKTLGLLVALGTAYYRFWRARKQAKRYGFKDVLVQLFGVVTTMTGVASIALDVERARRIASTLDPFMHLPERLTPVGIGQFCASLAEIGAENQSHALGTWKRLLARFQDPKWYISLPDRVRPLYIGGIWFARGVFETFRDGNGALEAAAELDALGVKLYRMIATEIRMLHHVNRGELELARQYREQLELHAIQIGSASQVELWEPAAMILPFTTMGDVVAVKRIHERLMLLAISVPSLQRYAVMAGLAYDSLRIERMSSEATDAAPAELYEVSLKGLTERAASNAPRSFIGWAALCGYGAATLNNNGRYVEAEGFANLARAHIRPEDRDFVALFLGCELECAVALAGQGRRTEATQLLDLLLQHHQASANSMTRGRLHDAYARVAALNNDWKTFRHHLEEARSRYRSTGVPSLIGRIETLAALEPRDSAPPSARTRSSNPAPTRVHTGRKDRTAASQSGVEHKDDAEVRTDTDDAKTVQR